MTKDKALITKDFFTELDFWDKLSREDQRTVQTETIGLSSALAGVAMLRMEMGERLAKIQTVLEPRREFKKYLKNNLHFSWRKGYRLIEVYKAIKADLPDYAIKLAGARNMDLAGYSAKNLYGAYSEPLKRLPPPSDEALVPEWLDRIEEEKRRHPGRRSKSPKTPDQHMKDAFRTCLNRFSALPPGKARTQWALRLVGILMGEFGLPGQTVKPEAVPEGFRAKKGRPKVRK